ncbi:DNA adenine methylase [Paenibacillus sp. J5C_2022]|uniref:DNA adenine methylase n=1 Tax=Paenibacillus sp. J5C2022 TaxID=2977129 RepID=UPI0021D1E292|nr:DNA adenine methylase [Paenibacillus sp. J5C2022]MCU6709379.1 DNA adenine methylase [Paenibacillus sp. J5C2022]
MPRSLTPLRYPGGKTKLYNTVLDLIVRNEIVNGTYIEPFAGGAGVAIRLLLDGIVSDIVLNDFDYAIYAIWKNITEHTDELCTFIETVPLTTTEWLRQRTIYTNQHDYSLLEVGQASFYLNRTNVSGVLTGGVIGGLSQEGSYKIDARFNRDNLIKMIQAIAQHKEHIHIYNWNAEDFILHIIPNFDNVFVYFDPPYVKKGPGLYRNSFSKEDHKALSEIIKASQFKWIVTYDKCELIEQLYSNFNRKVLSINYSAGQTKSGNEIIIYGNNIVYQENIGQVSNEGS